jgi:serpin B
MKLICALLFALASSTDAADIDPSASFRTSPASRATNEFGLDLYHQLAKQDENLCLSPYSIETAVAMTFAGADGETREQMTHVLHFPKDTDAIHGSFKSLQQSLEEMAQKTAVIAEHSKKSGGPSEPIALAIANRLFGQTGDDFHDSFQQLVKKFYGGALEPLDFKKKSRSGEDLHQQMGG